MKKIIMSFLLIVSIFSFTGCGKDGGILGSSTLGNSTILNKIENKNLKLNDVLCNEKYGYFDKRIYNQWVFYIKYAKEIIQAYENEARENGLDNIGLNFKVTNSDDINEIQKYAEDYTNNPDNELMIEFLTSVEDIYEYVAYKKPDSVKRKQLESK